jgi:hypothetical protein
MKPILLIANQRTTAICAFLLGLGAVYLLFAIEGSRNKRPNVSQEAFDRIRLGMKEEEVNQLLNCTFGAHFCGTVFFTTGDAMYPITWFSGRRIDARKWGLEFLSSDKTYVTKAWIGNACGIWVTFLTRNHSVVAKHIHPVITTDGGKNGIVSKFTALFFEPERQTGSQGPLRK